MLISAVVCRSRIRTGAAGCRTWTKLPNVTDAHAGGRLVTGVSSLAFTSCGRPASTNTSSRVVISGFGPMFVVPGLLCNEDTFSSLVLLYTGDEQLAARVRDAKLTPWTLCQAAPFVDGDSATLLTTHKPLLCSIAGVPERPHWTAPRVDEPEPPATPALWPAARLRNKRLRVSLRSRAPPFRRIDDGHIACNGCGTSIRVATDAALIQQIFMPAWHELHWKTFLCEQCTARARVVSAAGTDVCRNCYGATAGETIRIPLCYARSDDPRRPRDIVLCKPCAAEPTVRAQLATVRMPTSVSI